MMKRLYFFGSYSLMSVNQFRQNRLYGELDEVSQSFNH